MTWLTMGHYSERNDTLRDLGFSSYKEYLRSDLWREIRSRVVHEGVVCQGCHSEAKQAHHEFYSKENLSGDNIEGIVPLCSECHEYIEFGKNSTKLTPTQVQYRLCKLRAKKAGKKVKVNRTRRNKKRSKKYKPTTKKQQFSAVCRDCGLRTTTTRTQMSRASAPRCAACGGFLEVIFYKAKKRKPRISAGSNSGSVALSEV